MLRAPSPGSAPYERETHLWVRLDWHLGGAIWATRPQHRADHVLVSRLDGDERTRTVSPGVQRENRVRATRSRRSNRRELRGFGACLRRRVVSLDFRRVVGWMRTPPLGYTEGGTGVRGDGLSACRP